MHGTNFQYKNIFLGNKWYSTETMTAPQQMFAISILTNQGLLTYLPYVYQGGSMIYQTYTILGYFRESRPQAYSPIKHWKEKIS